MTLGEKIRFLRMKESITQEGLAERLNVSRSAIAKWETDNGTPDISNLKMISQMFAISIDELLSDEYGVEEPSLKVDKSDTSSYEYGGYYCTIELKASNFILKCDCNQ
ncbi:MAG: helix-turn-helix transcriptional regulator [Agathobacter sp.]|nr:helix-turn-helix transcriptional regulator [Agathobacter sp.]